MSTDGSGAVLRHHGDSARADRDPRRRFNARERLALYMAARGRCERCGAELGPSWHSDHVNPWSLGGETDVINGQALCSGCNLRKGNTALRSPRNWQKLFFTKYHANTDRDFLCVACPGAGKSYAAAAVAVDKLRAGTIDRIVVLVPSGQLRMHWSDTFREFGIGIDGSTMNGRAGEMETVGGRPCHGWALTYQSMASDANTHRIFNSRKRTLAILDEVHHLGSKKTWGEAALKALEPCTFRLALSGTAFRTDGDYIPFVEHDRNGNCRFADDEDGTPYPRGFDYSYGAALSDKPSPVREVVFEMFSGDVEWMDGLTGQERHAEISNKMGKKLRSKTNKHAINPAGSWLRDAVARADARLTMVRDEGDARAKGLIICVDTEHAHAVAAAVHSVTGAMPSVAVSKDAGGEDSADDARKVIDKFGKGNARWLISVAMVSEGVDIPELRVGVYATTVRSELRFRQVVGRCVRWRSDLPKELDQTAYWFIPKDPAMVEMSDRISIEAAAAMLRDEEDEETGGGCGGGGGQPSLFEDSFLRSSLESGGFLIPQRGSVDHELVDRVASASGQSPAQVATTMATLQGMGMLGVMPSAVQQESDPTETRYDERIAGRKRTLQTAVKKLTGLYLRNGASGEFSDVVRRLQVDLYRRSGITDYKRADIPQLDEAVRVVRKMWDEADAVREMRRQQGLL